MNNRSYNQPYTKDELLAELRRFYEENGRSPIAKELNSKYGYPSYSVYRKKFKSLNVALQLLDLDVNRFTNCTREFLIERLREFYHTYGRSPSVKDIDKLPTYPGVHQFEYMFGSWNAALIEAGLELNNPSCYSDEYLISELCRYVKTYDTIPRRDDFDKIEGYPSASVLTRAFGSFNNALKAAGLPISTNAKYDYTIQNVCTSCGCAVQKNGNVDPDGNFICKKCWTNIWRKNNYEIYKTWLYKRKNYGFSPLNRKFKGSNAHHLWLADNRDLVIHIPEFIHLLNWHNHNKPETMLTPNAIAIDYWVNEDFYNELYLTGDVSGT